MNLARLSLLILLALSVPALSQGPPPDPHSVPVVDGGLGPCTADFTVTDTNAKPVYNAKIDVRISYGRFHKLDLEVGTNVDGKGRFTGLPTNPKSGLFFEASESDRSGNAFDDPSRTCKAKFSITLRRSLQPSDPE